MKTINFDIVGAGELIIRCPVCADEWSFGWDFEPGEIETVPVGEMINNLLNAVEQMEEHECDPTNKLSNSN